LDLEARAALNAFEVKTLLLDVETGQLRETELLA